MSETTRSMSLRPLFVFGFLLLVSCSEDKKQSTGPIVLGDSSSIVTETDPKYLSDYVDDIRTAARDTVTAEPASEPQEQTTTAQPAQETPASSQAQQPVTEAPTGNGLKIPFREVTVFIPGIQTKSYRQQDFQKANGATFQWLNGKISGNVLQVSGATITKVSQRYTTRVVAKTSLGSLQLDALGNTTDWQALRGNGNSYTISGLERPQAKNATPAQIRLAVSRAAKNKRMSRQNIQKWEREVRNVRSLNQRPFQVSVRSVMWKIEGKDAQGKPFQKQVRIDINS